MKYYSQSNKTKKKKERGERKRKRNSKGKSIKLQSLLLTLLFLVIASEGTEHFLADNYVEQRDRNHYLKSVSSFSLPRCPVLNAMSLQIILPILFFNSIVCTFSLFLTDSHSLLSARAIACYRESTMSYVIDVIDEHGWDGDYASSWLSRQNICPTAAGNPVFGYFATGKKFS